MKRYFKFILLALIAIVFIGTFVFLYIKSQPQPVVYDEFTPKTMDIRKTTVVTGKIEPRQRGEHQTTDIGHYYRDSEGGW